MISDTVCMYCFVGAFCGPAPIVTNAYLVNSSGVYGGEGVTYYCRNGHSTVDTLSVVCLSNGVWETPPTCLGQCLPLRVCTVRMSVRVSNVSLSECLLSECLLSVCLLSECLM